MIGTWLVFQGLDSIRPAMTNTNTTVYDAARDLGASECVATAVDIVATQPEAPLAIHRGMAVRRPRIW